MKPFKIVLLSISLLAVFMTFPLFAVEPMNAEIIGKIVNVLQKEGYTGIRKIKLKDDFYWVDAFTAQGQRVKIQLDPKIYAILEPRTGKTSLTIPELAQKIQEAGFTEIYVFESEDDAYEVIASNKNRKKVKLFINASTGKITDSVFNYLK